MSSTIVPSADVDPSAQIGDGCRIWHLAQVREDAVLGSGCVIGRGAYVDAGVRVGRNCKIQNYAMLFAPATLGDGVFVGPGAVLTNDRNPRAVDPEGMLKAAADWEPRPVEIGEGASVGARSVLVAGVRIGPWALVGAGAVVTSDVPAFGLVVGNPARRIGWVGRAGFRLVKESGNRWRCPHDGSAYDEHDGRLDEAAP